MIRSATLLLAGLVVLTATPAAASDPAIPGLDAEARLRALLVQRVYRSNISDAFYALGVARFCAIVRPGVDKTIVRHLPRWRELINFSYTQTVPAEVRARAATEVGPVAMASVRPFMENFNARLQADVKQLLAQGRDEILEPVFAEAKLVPQASSEDLARTKELMDAEADGSLRCGLVPKSAEKK